MPSADRFEEFVAIVEASSISAAARKLGLPRATLSRRLSALEDELGVRLIHRATRRLTLTRAGESLLERARALVEDTEATWRAIAQFDDVPRGRLRVAMPPTALFHRVLLEFAEKFPEVELELAVSPRVVDLLTEGVDVAMRFGPPRSGQLVARKLWSTRVCAVAAPDYLKREGTPRTPTALTEHRCLVGFASEWRANERWPLLDGGSVEVRSVLVCDELPLLLHAALLGQGITLCPEPVAEPYFKSNQLRRVLPGCIGGATGASLVLPERQFVPPQVRAFVDHVVEHFSNPEHLPTLRPEPVS